jgi:hypothetical protein
MLVPLRRLHPNDPVQRVIGVPDWIRTNGPKIRNLVRVGNKRYHRRTTNRAHRAVFPVYFQTGWGYKEHAGPW